MKGAGYEVAANFIVNEAQAKAFGEENGVSVYQWDVSDFDQCAQGVEKICADFGGNIEILVNNAGITRDRMLHKMTPDEWNAVITTNLTSCFNMCHAVIPLMREKQFGRIVSISSVNAELGQIGQTNYAASKTGIIGFTKSLARENATKGITANTIAPGYTETDMVKSIPPDVMKSMIAQIPIGRLMHPDEIARAVLFLVEDETGCITGETIPVNGGQFMGT